jgi:phosphatidylinositol-3-phosphatase
MRLLGIFAALAAALAPHASASAATPPVKHVFVIVLENKSFDESFGPDSKAPYLATTLRQKGNLLSNYYGTSHASLGNYLTMISGQAANPTTQSDCFVPYADMLPGTIGPDGQAIGQGCVYPKGVKTIANQLDEKGLGWRGYMEDMGTPCRHPAIGTTDDTQRARPTDQYATRHNPFVYFRSVIDSPTCAKNDVDLSQLATDIKSEATTPSFALITPDLCSDGHDTPCVDGRPGGLESVNAFLEEWVPRILASPGFSTSGMLLITYDESEGGDAEACCNEPTGPNTPKPGISGPGGGRIGALVLSPFAKPGSTSTTPYNHYSLLRSLEDLYGLAHLGYAAQDGLAPFGSDVYDNPSGCVDFGAGPVLAKLRAKRKKVTFTSLRAAKIRIRAKTKGRVTSVGPTRLTACKRYSVRLPKGATSVTVSAGGTRTVAKLS